MRFAINGGSVTCDVCGDGHNRLEMVFVSGGSIDIWRTSRCYGDEAVSFTKLQPALDYWDKWSCLMSWRSSVREWRRARRMLVRHYREAPAQEGSILDRPGAGLTPLRDALRQVATAAAQSLARPDVAVLGTSTATAALAQVQAATTWATVEPWTLTEGRHEV